FRLKGGSPVPGRQSLFGSQTAAFSEDFMNLAPPSASLPLANPRKQKLMQEIEASLDEAERWRKINEAYHADDIKFMRFLIPPGKRVLELGCGTGELLAALEPSLGVGVDFAPEMLKRAAQNHPQLSFIQGDVEQLGLNTKFDYVILSDLVNDLWDVQTVIERLASVCTPATRVIINIYSRLWTLPLGMAARMKLANPALNQNWLTLADLGNML